jgi:hypothetical protein
MGRVAKIESINAIVEALKGDPTLLASRVLERATLSDPERNLIAAVLVGKCKLPVHRKAQRKTDRRKEIADYVACLKAFGPMTTEAAVAVASKQLGVSRWLAMEAVTKFGRKAPPFALQYGSYRWT